MLLFFFFTPLNTSEKYLMSSPENELILSHRFLCHSSEVLRTVLIKLAYKNVQICVRGAGITSEFAVPAVVNLQTVPEERQRRDEDL